MIALICLAAFAETPAPDVALATDEDALAAPDRTKTPEVLPPSPLKLDDLTRYALSDTVEVWHVKVPRLRRARVEVFWWKGRVELSPTYDPAISAMGGLWDVASEAYDGDALSILADTREIAVVSSVGDHMSSLELSAPVEELSAGIDVLADVLFHPTFPKRELKLTQENSLRWWTSNAPSSPASVAGSAVGYAWNPPTHPYGWRPDLDAFMAMKTADLFEVHDRLLRSGPVSILVVGDVDWATIEPQLKAKFAGLGAAGERAEALDAPMPSTTRVIAVDMPRSEQALIRLRMPGPARPSEDRVGMEGASYALGGHFLARLNKNLREDKGWTYGVNAGYGAGDKRGSFSVAVDVPSDKFAVAVAEIERELAGVAGEGVTPAEMDAFWRQEVSAYNSVRGTSDSAYGYYYGKLEREETIADDLALLDRIRGTPPATVQEVAGRWLGAEAPRVWVVVGPRADLEAGFTELGWTPQWVSPEDAVLGKFE